MNVCLTVEVDILLEKGHQHLVLEEGGHHDYDLNSSAAKSTQLRTARVATSQQVQFSLTVG